MIFKLIIIQCANHAIIHAITAHFQVQMHALCVFSLFIGFIIQISLLAIVNKDFMMMVPIALVNHAITHASSAQEVKSGNA